MRVTQKFDYVREPAAITARSFELARAASDLSRVPPDLHHVALRMVHALPQRQADLPGAGTPPPLRGGLARAPRLRVMCRAGGGLLLSAGC